MATMGAEASEATAVAEGAGAAEAAAAVGAAEAAGVAGAATMIVTGDSFGGMVYHLTHRGFPVTLTKVENATAVGGSANSNLINNPAATVDGSIVAAGAIILGVGVGSGAGKPKAAANHTTLDQTIAHRDMRQPRESPRIMPVAAE